MPVTLRRIHYLDAAGFDDEHIRIGFSRPKNSLAILERAARRQRFQRRQVGCIKLREGNAIGAKVTLRGARMWEFFDRLVSIAIPRVRDFRGLPPDSFDGHGNYTFGVTEQLIFPEINYDRIDTVRGMDITICTTARTDDEARALMAAFGFPFRTGDITPGLIEPEKRSRRPVRRGRK